MSRLGTKATISCVALALGLVARDASAGEPRPDPGPFAGRPTDAPNVDADARIPPLPPEYLVQDEGWIRFSYHPSARERIRPLIARAAAIRAELQELLGDAVLQSVDVRVALHPGELARLAPIELPGYSASASFGRQHLVVMSLASPLSLEPPDLEDGFRHALAHLALDEALSGQATPRWFHEGFAVHVADEAAAVRAQTLAMATLRRRLVRLPELDAQLPAEAPQSSIAYAEMADVVRFLLEGPRRQRLRDLMLRMRGGEPFERALAGAYGAGLPEVEAAWRKDVARRYGFVPVLLGAALLWITIVAVALVRRMRSRRVRRPLLVRRARILDEGRAHTATAPVGVVRLRRREMASQGGHPEDVPKVEHGGRWYTLH